MRGTVAVVVHYGNADLTRRCLRSLAAADPPPELVVVDNQGDAPSWPPAERSSVHLLSAQTNLGFGRGANLGIAWALDQRRFDSVLILNNDVTVESDAVARLADALESSADCGLAAPRILLEAEPATLWYGGGEIDWLRGSARVPHAGGDPESNAALESRTVGFASGCAMMLRAETLRQTGGFDPRFFLYEEDVELGLRLRAAGWRSTYVPEAIVHHRGQGSQRRTDEPFRPLQDPENPRWETLFELQVSNRLLAMTEHARGWQRVRFRIGFPLYVSARCLRYLAGGRLRAPAAALRGWMGYRRLRRQPFIDELTPGPDTV